MDVRSQIRSAKDGVVAGAMSLTFNNVRYIASALASLGFAAEVLCLYPLDTLRVSQ